MLGSRSVFESPGPGVRVRQGRETGPGGERDRETGPGGERGRETGPGGERDRETGPGVRVRQGRETGGERDRETGPGGERDRETGPGGERGRETGPGGERDRETGPGGERDRETGPGGERGQTEDDVVTEGQAVLDISDKMCCSTCQCNFDNREDQTEHYKLDWHRFNLRQRLLGAQPVSTESFEKIAGEISSISGSESEISDFDTEPEQLLCCNIPNVSCPEDEEVPEQEKQSGRRTLRVLFQTTEGEYLSVYRCVLQGKQDLGEDKDSLLSSLLSLNPQTIWVILMTGGGHFAGAVFQGNETVLHKTFHRYTVRAKRGVAQSARDAQNRGRTPKSAGASLRRYNEAALVKDVEELLASWSEFLRAASAIFFRASSYNKSIFFSGKEPVLSWSDNRLRSIPFLTRRATFKEVKRVHAILSTMEIYGEFCIIVQNASNLCTRPSEPFAWGLHHCTHAPGHSTMNPMLLCTTQRAPGDQARPSELCPNAHEPHLHARGPANSTRAYDSPGLRGSMNCESVNCCSEILFVAAKDTDINMIHRPHGRVWHEKVKAAREASDSETDGSKQEAVNPADLPSSLETVEETLGTLELREFDMSPKKKRKKRKKKVHGQMMMQSGGVGDVSQNKSAEVANPVTGPFSTGGKDQAKNPSRNFSLIPTELSEQENACYRVMNELYTACKTGDVEHLRMLLHGVLPVSSTKYGCPAQTASSSEVAETKTETDLEQPSETQRQMGQGKDSKLGTEHDTADSLNSGAPGREAQWRAAVTVSLLCEALDDTGFTLLHVAAAAGQPAVLRLLMDAGSDPAIRDKHNRPAYAVSANKETRNEFRRYMADHPDRYNYTKAQISAPLSSELEFKKAEKKRVQRMAKKQRERELKAEKKRMEEEEMEKKRYSAMSEREKRALAAEKRFVQQLANNGTSNTSRCWLCGESLLGRVPFEYLDYTFCTTRCLQEHRKQQRLKE